MRQRASLADGESDRHQGESACGTRGFRSVKNDQIRWLGSHASKLAKVQGLCTARRLLCRRFATSLLLALLKLNRLPVEPQRTERKRLRCAFFRTGERPFTFNATAGR